MRRTLVLFAIALSLSACSNNSTSSETTAAASPQTAASSQTAQTSSDLYYGAHLPPGPELSALKTNCEICHSGDMYATQRLSKATWTAEVTKMRHFGSPLPASEVKPVIAYLTKYLGPAVPRSTVVPTATAPAITYSSAP